LDEQERHDQRHHVASEHGNPRAPAKQCFEALVASEAGVDRSHAANSCAFGAIRKRVVATLLPVGRQRTRWEEDNVAPLNVAAFVVVGAILLGIAGLVLAVALT
jgi:hypothetical protein